MHIIMVGTGYVGLVTGACLAELGARVTCVDKDSAKIDALQNGEIPIYEPGLQEIVIRNYEKAILRFSDDLAQEVAKADVIFLAVGTPTNEEDGSADLSYIFAAVDDIAASLTKDCVIVTKSTVPVGTGAKIEAKLMQLRPDIACDIVSNPEFLREGSAVNDFLHPDRLIVGTSSKHAREVMRQLYWNLIERDVPIVFTDIATSELIKYASNAFLATKIAFINEMADICEKVGADIGDVSRGMGMDKRIGKKHLQPGPGYGGSCFPKDTKAIAHTARKAGVPSIIVETVIESNQQRKIAIAHKIIAACDGNVKGKNIAVLGVAFKANTDDMRDSASLVILPELHKNGAIIRAYDPVAMDEAEKYFETGMIAWHNTIESVLDNADVAVVLTEWDEFTYISPDNIYNALAMKLVVDTRNLFDPAVMAAAGLRYISLGRAEQPTANPPRRATA